MGLCAFRLTCFDQVRDIDAAQQVLDAVIDLAQRLFDGTGAGQIAGAMDRDAAGDEERTIDCADHLEGCDLIGRAGQSVSPVRPGMRYQQATFGESLKDLRKELRWNMVSLGDILSAVRGAACLFAQILQGHQAIIRFFSKPKHRFLVNWLAPRIRIRCPYPSKDFSQLRTLFLVYVRRWGPASHFPILRVSPQEQPNIKNGWIFAISSRNPASISNGLTTRTDTGRIQPTYSKLLNLRSMNTQCKHPIVKIVSRDEDAEYVECQTCGEIFDSTEFRDIAIEEEVEAEAAEEDL